MGAVLNSSTYVCILELESRSRAGTGTRHPECHTQSIATRTFPRIRRWSATHGCINASPDGSNKPYPSKGSRHRSDCFELLRRRQVSQAGGNGCCPKSPKSQTDLVLGKSRARGSRWTDPVPGRLSSYSSDGHSISREPSLRQTLG